MSPVSRERAPAPAPLRPFELPRTEAFALRSGLEVRVTPMAGAPLVTAALVLPARESALPPGHAGLAALTATGLDGGTARRDGRQLAEAFESMGTALIANAGWDATTVSLSCLPERLPEALDLLAEVADESVFPDSELERARDGQISRIRQRGMDPSSLASDWASRLLYDDASPYGRPVMGTADAVAAHDRARVADFASSWYRPRGAGLVLAGDVAAGVGPLLEACFASWEGQVDAAEARASTARTRTRTLHLVHRPGALQSEVRAGHPGPARDHPDYFDLTVANTVLGGSFTSRLNATLRERHGYTYGARSRFSFRRGNGPFTAATSVGRDVTAPAVAALLAELERFAEEGPTADETAAARDYEAGVFPLAMETTAQVAGHAAELLIYGLPLDHHTHYRDRIRAVSAESAREAIRRHLRPREMTIVVIGDADRVHEPLAALGVAPLELHDTEI